MRLLPVTFLLLLLPCVLNALSPKVEQAYSISLLSTMSVLEHMLPKEATSNPKPLSVKTEEMPTFVREVSCRRFTVRRAIGCLCEITREELSKRAIPRAASLTVINSCTSLLGVEQSRFERICRRMGFDISGNPRTSVNGIRGALVRCGPRVGIGSMTTMIP